MEKEELGNDPITGEPMKDPRIKMSNLISSLKTRVKKDIQELKNV